jgi:hypothetical protein
MSIGRTVYINGTDHDQMELTDDEPIGFLIGLETPFQPALKREFKIPVAEVGIINTLHFSDSIFLFCVLSINSFVMSTRGLQSF